MPGHPFDHAPVQIFGLCEDQKVILFIINEMIDFDTPVHKPPHAPAYR